ncbi:hypothetical protein MSAN_01613000 [Mycena sanguinolenta]|uniref:Uncharacterized protein n=1 Tax=Mycena sanguinolenta TaxID=230812 RepID=A0A8H6Y0J0_9AGAR|nr:hypothetical protein MSAN_01613000 [Mycena sanguinolenta]
MLLQASYQSATPLATRSPHANPVAALYVTRRACLRMGVNTTINRHVAALSLVARPPPRSLTTTPPSSLPRCRPRLLFCFPRLCLASPPSRPRPFCVAAARYHPLATTAPPAAPSRYRRVAAAVSPTRPHRPGPPVTTAPSPSPAAASCYLPPPPCCYHRAATAFLPALHAAPSCHYGHARRRPSRVRDALLPLASTTPPLPSSPLRPCIPGPPSLRPPAPSCRPATTPAVPSWPLPLDVARSRLRLRHCIAPVRRPRTLLSPLRCPATARAAVPVLPASHVTPGRQRHARYASPSRYQPACHHRAAVAVPSASHVPSRSPLRVDAALHATRYQRAAAAALLLASPAPRPPFPRSTPAPRVSLPCHRVTVPLAVRSPSRRALPTTPMSPRSSPLDRLQSALRAARPRTP